jgi:hypothetical protein
VGTRERWDEETGAEGDPYLPGTCGRNHCAPRPSSTGDGAPPPGTLEEAET